MSAPSRGTRLANPMPMTRETAKDFHLEALQLFDEYVQGRLPRREFLERAGKFAVPIAATETLLFALSPDFAIGQRVAGNDVRLEATYAEYPSPEGHGTLRGYLVRPVQARGELPTILVAHENHGLSPHIEDIARRLALDDFIAFAPEASTHADFRAAAVLLEKLPGGNGKVGVVGFSYGGGIANYLATRVHHLGAAVSFYGAQPSAADAAGIKTPLLLHYAGNDQRITSGWPAYEAALLRANVAYKAFIYAGIEHGFNNDTTASYDAAAAHLAWLRTVEFFDKYLRA